ncbi:MAG TPA: ABC transporter ATP-binding protein [Gemmatimonadaceae bacterium]|jgi:ABC-2 type transport system ATP-binding protein
MFASSSTNAQPVHDASTAREAVIDVRGLTMYFGKRQVVDQLTMQVPRGSVFAFLGRNGSGKTTTIRMLLGLLPPTRGSSTVLGCDSQHLTPEIHARVGYMSESHALYDWMTVKQSGEFASKFYAKWNQRVFDTIVGHFGLGARAKAGHLSRGERAGLSLALTLAPEPELLVLDDPAIGLDPVARRSLLESMVFVTRGAERTIFFSSHLLDDVERVADHVAILDRSVLRACASTETLRASVRQFVLRFESPDATPREVSTVRGLLSMRRSGSQLTLVIAKPDEATLAQLRAIGASSIDDGDASFSDAITGYLGARGDDWSFLERATAGATNATTSGGAV